MQRINLISVTLEYLREMRPMGEPRTLATLLQEIVPKELVCPVCRQPEVSLVVTVAPVGVVAVGEEPCDFKISIEADRCCEGMERSRTVRGENIAREVKERFLDPTYIGQNSEQRPTIELVLDLNPRYAARF